MAQSTKNILSELEKFLSTRGLRLTSQGRGCSPSRRSKRFLSDLKWGLAKALLQAQPRYVPESAAEGHRSATPGAIERQRDIELHGDVELQPRLGRTTALEPFTPAAARGLRPVGASSRPLAVTRCPGLAIRA